MDSAPSLKPYAPLKGLCDSFDIVTAPYFNLQGVKSIGLFLIVYKESLDSAMPMSKNVTGLKITSKDSYPSKYRIELKKYDVPKLKTDSYVYANHPYTLAACDCVHVCKLPARLYREIALKLSLYTASINGQLINLFTKGDD